MLLCITVKSELLRNSLGNFTYIYRNNISAGVQNKIYYIVVLCLWESARRVDQWSTRTKCFNSRPANNEKKVQHVIYWGRGQRRQKEGRGARVLNPDLQTCTQIGKQWNINRIIDSLGKHLHHSFAFSFIIVFSVNYECVGFFFLM